MCIFINMRRTSKSKNKSKPKSKSGYRGNADLALKSPDKRIKSIKRSLVAPSGPELKFMYVLILLNLKKKKDYIFQYDFHGRLFDFYLVKYDILIEVDGDFHHVNPKLFECKYPIQEVTVKNDKYKDRLCKRHGTKLIRFWEDDLNNRPEWIITEMKKILG